MRYRVKIANNILFENVKLANNFWSRSIGLMFRSWPSNMDALLISPCQSIHTCFMKYNIDVIFIDKSNVVVKTLLNVKPWRMTWFYFNSKKVIETKAGLLNIDVKKGDKLLIESVH